MKAITLGTVGAILLACLTLIGAEPPNLSGTWKLDASRSSVTAATLAGLAKAGAPETLHITQAASGALVVESQINESQSRIYVPGAKTTTLVVPSGSITMTSKWEGGVLVSEGTQESASAAPTSVKEAFTLGVDGRTLTIVVTTTRPDSTSASTLIYARTTDVQPCQKWPTPCK